MGHDSRCRKLSLIATSSAARSAPACPPEPIFAIISVNSRSRSKRFTRQARSYEDRNLVMHGFVLRPPATFLPFSYPGATYTPPGGINDRGLICGDYIDSFNLRRGFIARIC